VDLIGWGFDGLAFNLQAATFLVGVWFYLRFNGFEEVYIRESISGLVCNNFILETHFLPDAIREFVIANKGSVTKVSKGVSRIARRCLFYFHLWIWKRAKAIVVTTRFIKEEIAGVGISPKKILIEPDSVDLELFDIRVYLCWRRRQNF
jgi:hypothetical protein